MPLERFVSCMACLLLGLGGAATAQAKIYSLTGGGGQLAVPGNRPMPIQAFPPGVTGTVFPPLGIPPAMPRPILAGTTAMAVQQKLSVPAGVLSRPAQQQTLGLFAQEPNLYALATNLGFVWPAAAAVLSTGARTGNKTTTFSPWIGGRIRYSNTKASKFGGPARFSISYGQQPQGRIPNSPVTVYLVAVRPTGNPPCTHTRLTPTPFPGPGNPVCVAALGLSWPLSVIGGPVSLSGNVSPLGAPVPGIGFGKLGASPVGTVSYFAWTDGHAPGFADSAWSVGYPWTTGMLSIMMTAVGETYTITGMDNRTPGGAGSIRLVAGSLSTRAFSGPNANRGWVRLELTEVPATPTMSPAGFAAAAGLLLLAAGYALRRRFSG